jgi:hypothetical protein
MSAYPELQTNIVDVMMTVLDISEKLQKFGTPELEKLVLTSVTSKRPPPLAKKLYDLGAQIEKFRMGVLRASMTAMKSDAEGSAAAVSVGGSDTSNNVGGESNPASVPPAPLAASAEDPIAPPATVSANSSAVETPIESTSVVVAKTTKKTKAGTGAGAGSKSTVPAATAVPVEALAAPASVPDSSPAVTAPTMPVAAATNEKKKSKKTQSSSDNESDSSTKEKASKKPRAKKTIGSETVPSTPVTVAAPDTVPVVPVAPEPPVATTAAAASSTTDESKEDTDAAPLHIKRKKIPKAIRVLVWNLHIGSHKGEDRCMSCKEKKIDIANFHCGHVLAEAKGGDLTIKNLRPICSACNSSMGTRSMNEFTKEFFGWEI